MTTTADTATWHTTLRASGTVTAIALSPDGGSWLCHGCGALGRSADHITTRGEAAAHLDACTQDDPPTVLTSPARAQTITAAHGTTVEIIRGHDWRCRACGEKGDTPHAAGVGATHAAMCGAPDPEAVARHLTMSSPTMQAAVEAAVAMATADRDTEIQRLTTSLAAATAHADDKRDAAARRVADRLTSDLRDLRGEAGRADTKASILAAATVAGIAAGVSALATTTGLVTAIGGAAVLGGVGVIGILLTVLRPRMSRDGRALVTAAPGDEHQAAHAPDLAGITHERRELQQIVAAKYKRITHAITGTAGAGALAVIAAALHIMI